MAISHSESAPRERIAQAYNKFRKGFHSFKYSHQNGISFEMAHSDFDCSDIINKKSQPKFDADIGPETILFISWLAGIPHQNRIIYQ